MSIRFLLAAVVGLSILICPAIAGAQSVSVKGMASVGYGWKLSATQRQDALRQAEVNAIERYIADTNAARSRVFESKRKTISAHISDYILGTTILSEQQDKASKTYTVVIRADINATRLLNELGNESTSAGNATSTSHPMLTFLFVARSQSSVQAFDDRTYKRSDADAAMTHTTHEGESVHNQSVDTSDGAKQHSSVSTTTGGSTTRKADKIEWSVTRASEINTAMTGVFADAGYDVIEADQVEGASNGLLDIGRIRDAYSHGNDLPAKMVRDTTEGVQQAGIGLLALGTLDVGMQDRDPVSGNVRVYVTVSGKVYNVTGRFARTISSVGPIQYAGLGPDANVARTNALKIAAQSTAHQMVDELNSKGIH
jgi:hypothetical protein